MRDGKLRYGTWEERLQKPPLTFNQDGPFMDTTVKFTVEDVGGHSGKP